jgi:hypothetical protein
MKKRRRGKREKNIGRKVRRKKKRVVCMERGEKKEKKIE